MSVKQIFNEIVIYKLKNEICSLSSNSKNLLAVAVFDHDFRKAAFADRFGRLNDQSLDNCCNNDLERRVVFNAIVQGILFDKNFKIIRNFLTKNNL